jgi:putative ABC transport system substrate-binding protein
MRALRRPDATTYGGDQVKRREFITLLGGAAAWPLAARAEQAPTPMIGFLHGASSDSAAPQLDGFLSLKDGGFVDGENLTIEYRWAQGRPDALPAMAAGLVRRRVTVIGASEAH